MKLIDQYIKEIEKRIKTSERKVQVEEVGTVHEVKDGVAILSGLDHVSYGEFLEFESGLTGITVDLTEESVGAAVLGNFEKIVLGEKVKGTGRQLEIPVGNDVLGRVLDPLGSPLDNKKPYNAKKFYPLEKIAPGVVKRSPVNKSLQTGIKAVDSLVPIGRGQRELIIGDRNTGKTTLVTDTIINQKGQNIICIYCSIGQKNSKIARIIDLFKKNRAFEYSLVVSASSSDSASMQYLAPYAACAIGEYFLDQGKDVVIAYDDLTKHAWAYRQISLILRRPAGREAYPGDVFYLHSRLLERACRLNEKNGGGSITALPIVETLEGDISSYIPTNIISITDGQIFLETDLFNAGIRPAINVGLSVSRVGSAAQSKGMKKIAGKLKLDLAQYRDLAAFSQFESELDEETKKLLNRGAKVTQVLKQPQNKPYLLAEEIAVIWTATTGLLDELPLAKIEEFEKKFLEDLHINGKKLLEKINKTGEIEKKDEDDLKKFAIKHAKI